MHAAEYYYTIIDWKPRLFLLGKRLARWLSTTKKGNPDRKTFAMWNIARIGRGKHQKACKQEIRREQNSNPLQRKDTLSQLTVNPSTSLHVTIMDELCIRQVLGKIITKLPTFRHYTCLHKIHRQWTLLSPEHYPTTNVTGLTLENQIAWKTAGLISRKYIRITL